MFTKSRTRLWRLAASGGTVVATAVAVAASTQAGVTVAQASVGPPSDESGNISASVHPTGTREDVFYVGLHSQIYRWQHRSGHWFNGPIGAGMPAETGSDVAAVWSPDGSSLNVFYAGINGHIFTWQYQNGAFANSELSTGTSIGEPAEAGTGLTAIWSANQVFENVFYVGTSGHIYAWSRIHGGNWGNSELSTGTSTGEAAETGTGLSAVWQPNGTTVNINYIGANGQIYTWQYHAGAFTNSPLGTGPGEPAHQGSGVPLVWQPNGLQANLFYRGANGQMYNWVGNVTNWPTDAQNAPL